LLSKARFGGASAVFWVALFLAIGVTQGEAAVRYAAPGATGSSPCPRAAPCSLFIAASGDAPAGERALDGDEVVVLPGEYFGWDGDLGPDESISLPLNVDVHGERGDPAFIESDNQGFVIGLNGGDTVSDLELVAVESRNPLIVLDSTAERLVVRDWGEEGIACLLGFRAVLRDSACISEGRRGAGAGERVSTNSPPFNPRTLRNVTAIGAGPESAGLLFDISDGEVFINVKSSLAQGTATDVEAIGSDAGGGSAIALEDSAFATANAVQRNGGFASVTEPGTHGNITAPPLLAADQVHELAGSPTIDTGAIDASSGFFDVDGGARVAGGHADIGADEMLIQTTTTVACLPRSLVFGQESVCAAAVDSADSSPPTGTVDFTGSSRAGLDELGGCALSASGPSQSTCSLRFPIFAVDPALELTARYSGDLSHSKSDEASQLTVAPDGTTTALSCEPARVTSGQSTVCSTTVTNSDPSSAGPSGTALFLSTSGGSFSPHSGCILAADGAGRAGCQTIYKPAATARGSASISATYLGDEGHLTSRSPNLSLLLSPLASVAPNTRLTRKPPHRSRRGQVTFAFISSAPDSGFECKLDGHPYRPCRSPFKIRATPGRHLLKVRAVGPAGADPTPASFRWKSR
jgi:hypothetical protein